MKINKKKAYAFFNHFLTVFFYLIYGWGNSRSDTGKLERPVLSDLPLYSMGSLWFYKPGFGFCYPGYVLLVFSLLLTVLFLCPC